jgi:hypothetical protein
MGLVVYNYYYNKLIIDNQFIDIEFTESLLERETRLKEKVDIDKVRGKMYANLHIQYNNINLKNFIIL